MTTKISEAMRALVPPPGAAEAAYPAAFAALADLLLNRATLQIAGEPHRFTEIEFYFKGHAHDDTFAHGDPMQKRFGAWYFHRTGGEYRGGTYKGLDVAFGDGDAFGGILLRGAERLRDQRYLDGPCVFVDHALALTGKGSVAALASSFDLSIDPAEGGASPLYLEPSAPRGLSLFGTPRVGLSLKRGNTAARQRFIGRHYRFLTDPLKCKKGKLHLVVALYQQGKSLAEICRLTGSREAIAKAYLDAHEAGKEKPFTAFGSELATGELCGLFGACFRAGYVR
jgi:hypothetical protein